MTAPTPAPPAPTRRRSRTPLLVGLAVVVVVAGLSVGMAFGKAGGDHRPIPKGPNVVVIMTDDQTLESVRVMAKTRQLLEEQGTSFTNYAVSFPNCCPSRATYLTGQYAHNTGVLDNVAPDGGFAKLRGDETLPVWLHRAGYYTAHVGKYLNTWGDGGDIEPPPGWDRWYGLIDPSTYRYFRFEISDDGTRKTFGNKVSEYSTDVLADEAVKLIHQRAGHSRPFYLSFTPLAPHVGSPEVPNGQKVLGMPEAPPRYAGRFAGTPGPRSPSYDQADISKLPQDVRRRPMTQSDARYISTYYQRELGAVLGVDDAVGRIMGALQQTGELDHTVVLFTSDNGLFHGEHRLRTGKYFLYEPSVHLPLFIRGGPFKAGATVASPAANVDLAPTILALTGAKAGITVDGEDLARVAGDPAASADRGILLENQRGHGKFHTSGIRTTRWKYLVHKTGEKELYDLRADPDEVHNLAGTPAMAKVQAGLATRLAELEGCAGATCER